MSDYQGILSELLESTSETPMKIDSSRVVESISLVQEKYGKGVEVKYSDGSVSRYVNEAESTEVFCAELTKLFEEKGSKEVRDVLDSSFKYKDVCESSVETIEDSESEPVAEEGPVEEATQAAAMPVKVDTGDEDDGTEVVIEPAVGRAYEFEDGVFVVDDIIDDKVYLIGPDDQMYVETTAEFKDEVVSDITDECEGVMEASGRGKDWVSRVQG